ncbi:MAG: hypothetical protein HY744_09225 [Deltaproteobacteria bacterium]|nr:hypothetical protein [Deltaproteobacteria bacterium]
MLSLRLWLLLPAAVLAGSCGLLLGIDQYNDVAGGTGSGASGAASGSGAAAGETATSGGGSTGSGGDTGAGAGSVIGTDGSAGAGNSSPSSSGSGGAGGYALLLGLRVFVTSATHDGNLGGLGDADEYCTKAAKNGKPDGGSWVAWLSAPGVNDTELLAPDRIVGSGPWRLVGSGTKAVESHDQLTSGSLSHEINVDENGKGVVPGPVWTGTTELGETAHDCKGWTEGSGGATGKAGRLEKADKTWTNEQSLPCTTTAHLYCFEQAKVSQ